MLQFLGRVRSCGGVWAGALIACLASCVPAWAQPINIELVLVGNAGNSGDPLRPGVGGVNYQYYISKREVTVGQWCAMLNSVSTTGETVLYTTNMTSMIARTGSPGSYVFTPIGDPQLPMRFVNYTMM
ncbi:MAG: hypothetical protein NTV94_00210, partial [Planctomycetota bacterium]|nr:hypothetical protein [Planctomycetota bacterium]